jgi:hypothetical protein
MAVVVESRIPDIAERAEREAAESVERRTEAVALGAKARLILQGSFKSGELFESVQGHADGFEGEIGAGDGLPDARAVYVELGTGERGSEYDFPGKPDGITYTMSWKKGIPKDPAHGFAYLIPALMAEREPFDEDAAGWYR